MFSFFCFFFQSCFKSATESHDQLHCKQRHKSRVTSKHPFFHGSFSLFTLQNSGTGQRSGPDPQIPPFSHSSHTISHLTEIKLHLLTVKTQNVPEPARPQSVNKQPLKGKFCLDRIQSWPKKPVWGSGVDRTHSTGFAANTGLNLMRQHKCNRFLTVILYCCAEASHRH